MKKKQNITKLSEFQFKNMLNFLDSLKGNEDELTSFLIHILDNTNENNYDVNSKIIKHFDKKVKELRKYTSRNLKN